MPGIWVAAIVLLVVVGSLGLISVVGPGFGARPGSTVSGPASHAQSGAAPPTHGDLVVASGQTYVIRPTLAGPTYYQGGNITVEAGGTLDVQNVSLSFVQYVADTGTAQQRLSHIFFFHDAGTVNFYDANLTTDVQVINAYAKLNLTVTGSLNAWNSTFAFPGWIYVNGGHAVMTLNQSTVTWNSDVFGLSEPSAILGDTLFAPTINVSGGASMNLFASTIAHNYADNTAASGYARPAPLTFVDKPGYIIASGTTGTLPVHGSSDSANLTLDWLYPAARAQSGVVTLDYMGSVAGISDVSVSAIFGGSYLLGSATIPSGTVAGLLEFPFSPALLSAISSGGMLHYLNTTGDFGVGSGISVQVQVTSGAEANLSFASFQLNTTGPTYDDIVTGAGSTLSAVDSGLGFNWNPFNASAGAAYSQVPPFPWTSNKLRFNDGAVGYLANITTPGASLPGVFGSSAILPDSSSQVYFYRWAQFNLTGRGGLLPIQDASLSAYYAYDSNQANNATTTALNHIETADPAIWGYLQYWDSFHGVLNYATSNAAGQAFLLLASGNLTASTLPDGIFLGGYHVGVTVPAVGVISHWFNWSVLPYPTGVAMGSPHYNGPDFAPPQGFPDYYGSVAVGGVTITANGVPAPAVDIGQTLGVRVKVVANGTATITQVLAELYYNSSLLPRTLLASNETTTLDLTASGQFTTLNLAWVVNDTVTGLRGWTLQNHAFEMVVDWNYNIPSLAGGSLEQSAKTSIDPSQIAITSFSPPPTTLQLTTAPFYFSSGTLAYNGSQPATVYLYATPVGGSGQILIAANTTPAGTFELPLNALSGVLSPGTSYTLTVTATYNGRSTNYTVPGTFTVPKSPSSPASFLFQTFLGLPIWAWLAIAGAAAVGIVLFLLFARRQAAGKLVECGECGNLIPEEATVCPKCGAEFESDLIRCSRCASTIPADSKFCPECAAQLLGKPGEAESDPEKQAYADFTQKYRAEAKRELGDNYTEGAFWDWWKRQPTYTPFSQWSLQQGQGTARAGMTAPPAGTETTPETPPGKTPPPKGGAGWTEGAGAAPPPPASSPAAAPPSTTVPPAAPGAGLKACPSCGKEIPAEYLVCPFCNAVTQ